MPIIKSAKKKLRVDQRKRAVNLRLKRRLKEALKQFDSKPNSTSLSEAYSILDTAAKKNLIPKKRADRKKSRLSATLTKNSPKSPSKKATVSKQPTTSSKRTRKTN